MLKKILKPRSIAVIGASPTEGTVGYEVMKNLISGRFIGRVYPINAKYNGMIVGDKAKQVGCQLHPYISSIEELPHASVDLAIIMTPNKTVPNILDEAGKTGVKAAVVITSGFQECGPQGVALAEQIKKVAEQWNMSIIGPNCLGIANLAPTIRMNATFAQAVPSSGHGALFSQSGAVGIDLLNRSACLGDGIRQFVSLGNELQIGAEHLLPYWDADPEIGYIVGYMESGQALAKLRHLAARITRHKPILMLNAGCSQAGAQAATSHTGALAGNRQAVDAMISQCGIQRFESISELFAAVVALENTYPSCGNRVVVYSNAGGYGVMIADLLEKPTNALQLASLAPETRKKLEAILPHTASKTNPIDTTATFPCDNSAGYEAGLQAVLADGQVDACIVSIIPLMKLCATEIVAIASKAQAKLLKPVVVVFSTEEHFLEEAERQLAVQQLPLVALYRDLEHAVIGLNALEHHRIRCNSADEQPVQHEDVDLGLVRSLIKNLQAQNRSMLTTQESLSVLDAYGIPVAPFRLANTLESAVEAATLLGYPLVLKLNSQSISHKTEIGAVIADIKDQDELKQSWDELLQRLRKVGIQSFLPGEGILVQTMVKNGIELILGAKKDPDFGPLILVGRGGVYTQLEQDYAFRLPPIGPSEARQMLSELRIYKALQGYRRKLGYDIDGIGTLITRLAQLMVDIPEIRELDINPLMALPVTNRMQSAGLAVDCRIILDIDHQSIEEE